MSATPAAIQPRRRASTRLALAGVLLAAGVALIGRGAFSTFTSQVSGGPQSVTTGTVTIALGATTGKTNRLTVNASGIAAGDTMQRSVDLTNSGSLNLASVTLGVTASASTALDTDSVNGLQLVVQGCPGTLTESGTSPAFTYTCSVAWTSVLASTSVSSLKTTAASLSGLSSLTAGNTDHLVFTLTLPSSNPGGPTFEGVTSTLSFNFTGTQRAAQAG